VFQRRIDTRKSGEVVASANFTRKAYVPTLMTAGRAVFREKQIAVEILRTRSERRRNDRYKREQ
jgi:hypothetical protein